jgi:predicted transcriptional regulator
VGGFLERSAKEIIAAVNTRIKTDNSVIKMFMHKGSIAIAHGNSLTWAF